MLLRSLFKISNVLAWKNVYVFMNSSKTSLLLQWGHSISISSGTKLSIVPISVIPSPCVVNVMVPGNIFRWSVMRHRLQELGSNFRYRKISPVFRARNCSWKNFFCLFQRNLEKCSRGSKYLTRIALGSGLFVPSVFFKTIEVIKEEKVIPIEIPKETKKPKPKKPLQQLLVNLYDFIRLLLRALRLSMTFFPIFAIYPLTYLGETPTELWWGLLVRAVEFSGPIVIKLGQWASTRRDLFSDSCCRQFARLQRRTKPHSWSFTAYRMRKAFGPNWRKVFVKFDNNRNPVGSGCVAQVYKAWMPKDAVPDEELLEEIVSEMEDDNSSTAFEGLEIQGFKKFFGLDNGEDKAQQEAIDDWRRNRDEKRLKEKEMEEKELSSQGSGTDSPIGLELNVSTVTEALANEMISGEGSQPLSPDQNDEDSAGMKNEESETDVMEHSLLEVWEETDQDKSLPVEEVPPEDLDGLIPVAVKVLHPAVHSYFKRDLKILRACAWFITIAYPPLRWLSLPQCVDEFAEVMSGQINLRKEAENLELFSDNFAEIPSIKFPRPLRPYVTQKVLVETYEEGEGMADFIGSSGEDKPDELKIHLAQIGVDALLKMVFLDNLVHGDLHPGNMLIQNINLNEDGSLQNYGDKTRIMMVDIGCDTFVMDVKPDLNPLRICLLDCGVVAKLKDRDLENFKGVFTQVVLGDGGSVADLFLENSEHNCKDPKAFKAEMTELVKTARQDAISLAQVDVGVLLQQVLGILLRHEVRLESAFSSVVLAVFVLEGLGRALDPNMDILERARPMLVEGAITKHTVAKRAHT